jgi:hypothetical protein
MGLVGWEQANGMRTILAGLSGYEVKNDHGAMAFCFSNNCMNAGASIANDMTTGGALALGDMNGDGHLALFVAGGVAPGRYPMAAPSKLYLFDGHGWKSDVRNNVLFENIGIVNSAVWSDLDGDGRPELILACEWGPIRVFHSRDGALFEITK